MNERLTIRNWHFEIFRWLPIGRCDIGHGSEPQRAGRDEDHKRRYRGNPGQLRQSVLFAAGAQITRRC